MGYLDYLNKPIRESLVCPICERMKNKNAEVCQTCKTKLNRRDKR
jgi:hypothetical protein